MNQVALSPDGRSVIALSADGALRWLEIATGQERLRWKGANALSLSPDGTLVASGSDGADVQVWELATGKLLKRLGGHRGPVYALAFSADGRRLASASADTTVLLWDVARFRPERRPDAAKIPAERLERLWDALAANADVAADAIAALTAAPEQAVALLQTKLSPVSGGAKRIGRLIADLDAEEFATREAAFHELALFGEAALPALRDAEGKKPSAELRRQIKALREKANVSEFLALDVRTGRALEVLEACTSPAAKRLLEALAQGDPDALLTRAARASLERLTKWAAKG